MSRQLGEDQLLDSAPNLFANDFGGTIRVSQSPLQSEIASIMVSVLNLEVEPGEIGPDETLFGEESRLALDSIDALELALELGEKFGIAFKPEDEKTGRVFGSLSALSDHVATNRTK